MEVFNETQFFDAIPGPRTLWQADNRIRPLPLLLTFRDASGRCMTVSFRECSVRYLPSVLDRAVVAAAGNALVRVDPHTYEPIPDDVPLHEPSASDSEWNHTRKA